METALKIRLLLKTLSQLDAPTKQLILNIAQGKMLLSPLTKIFSCAGFIVQVFIYENVGLLDSEPQVFRFFDPPILQT